MTETECQYAQIDKEALAVTWACKKFANYIVCKRILIETDHKPLVPILNNKDLDTSSPRCWPITSSLPAQEGTLESFATEQSKDPTLSWVKSYCRSGCPAQVQLDNHVLPYWPVRDSLTVAGNFLLYNHCVVIPPALWRSILKKIHGPHQGLQKSRLCANCSVWWPHIGQQLDNFIKTCSKCAEYSTPA